MSGSEGKAEIESAYPFCFDGDAKSSNGTRSIALLPVQPGAEPAHPEGEELGAAAKVTWGTRPRNSPEQLAAGINLRRRVLEHAL